MFSYIRNDLKDSAFWSGAIYTQDGKATVRFTLPENMTTRTLDAIGITVDSRLGTTTEEIIAKKPLIVETNPPLYLTIGDTLQIPVKMIVSEDILK